MNQYIEFKLIEKKRKTEVYSIQKKGVLFSLGIIKWFGAWRKYCFFPEEELVFDVDCLQEIIIFIKKLMDERKEVKKLIKAKKKFDTGDPKFG